MAAKLTQILETIKLTMGTMMGSVKGSMMGPRREKLPEGPRRPMKYPYTFSAKIIQFPWAFYVKNNWMYRYYFIALVVSLPAFYKINALANSDGNKQKWAETVRKQEHHD